MEGRSAVRMNREERRPMNDRMHFSCSVCNREYPIDTRDFRCTCGGPFKLSWKSGPFPISALRGRGASLWRYRESLPVTEDRNMVSLGEGMTPLIPFPYKDFKEVLLKLDFLCPTGSYKDRGSSVMISKLREMGIAKVVADSSGNAGSSIAGYAAKAGIKCKIYCPAHVSEGKLVQIRAYGAQLVKVEGTRADMPRKTGAPSFGRE
jgi:threonine synthase